MAEPRAIELQYVKALRAVWRTAQAIIAYGMRPLVAAWPTAQADHLDDKPDDEDPTAGKTGKERAAAAMRSLRQ